MSRAVALELAEPDPLGTRWASARRRGRVYLAWQSADGSGGVQVVHEFLGMRRYRRIPTAPGGLCWRPVRKIWAELSVTTAD